MNRLRTYEHLVMTMAGEPSAIDLQSIRYHLSLLPNVPLLAPAMRSSDDAELLRRVHEIRSCGGPWATWGDAIESRLLLRSNQEDIKNSCLTL